MKKNLTIIFSLIFFINTTVFAEKVDALKKFKKEILGEEAKKKMSLAYDSLTKHKQILNYNTDEEAVDDEEAMDEEEEGKDVVDGDKVMCKGCLKERFFDFIFEAEEFMTPDSHKKRLHYEKIFRDGITETIEKDESNKAENVDEMIEDVEHLHNEFDEDGNICFKYCSKRKINSISDMVDALLDNELGDDLKKSNPRKFKYIKELLKPYRRSIRKLRDPAVDIHEKRKVLQKPMVGEGLLDSVESVVIPMLKKKRC